MQSVACRPEPEPLDGRILPAAILVLDLGVQGQVLVLEGTDAADSFLLTDREVRVDGLSRAVDPDVLGVVVLGGAGDDRIVDVSTRANVLRGDAGDDLIVVRPAAGFFPKVVYGGPGTDTILGDPTASAIIPDAVDYLTVDLIGPVAVFGHDGPDPLALVVTTDPAGNTVVSEPTGETLLPPEIRIGIFDLAAADTLVDSSPAFETIVFGGTS